MTVTLLATSSCKKDWNCSCTGNVTTTYPTMSAPPTVTPVNANEVLHDMKQNTASQECETRKQLWDNMQAINTPYQNTTVNVSCSTSPL